MEWGEGCDMEFIIRIINRSEYLISAFVLIVIRDLAIPI